MAIYWGFNPPFYGGPQNILSRQEDDRLIKNDLLQLLLTVPGERVQRSDFGTPLRSFVFEQMVQADLDFLTSQIREAIGKFEPRVEIQALQLTKDVDANMIRIYLVVNLVKDPKKQLTIDRFVNETVARQ